MHFWVEMLFDVIKSGTLYRSFLWFPQLQRIAKLLYSYSFLPKELVESRKKHSLYARNQMDKYVTTYLGASAAVFTAKADFYSLGGLQTTLIDTTFSQDLSRC
jgi:hypothetical protein